MNVDTFGRPDHQDTPEETRAKGMVAAYHDAAMMASTLAHTMVGSAAIQVSHLADALLAKANELDADLVY